jgi:hypothetical protein
MENKNGWEKGLKYFGIAVLILAIPGSAMILPAFFGKKLLDKKKSNDILGI